MVELRTKSMIPLITQFITKQKNSPRLGLHSLKKRNNKKNDLKRNTLAATRYINHIPIDKLLLLVGLHQTYVKSST